MAINETIGLTASFTTAGGKVLSKRMTNVTINDTSKKPTYTAGFFTDNLAHTPMSSVNEGDTAYIVLITTGVPDFTYLDWEVTGAGITLDDTDVSVLSGQAMIHVNKYWATIKPKLDLITEGNETLTITFKRDGVIVASASIVINDTSSGVIISNEDVTMYYNERSMQGDNFRIYSAGFDPVGPMKIAGVVYNDLTDILVLRERLNVKTAGPLFNLFSKYSKISAIATLANGTVVNVSWSYQTTSGGGRLYNYDGSPNIGNFHNRIKPYHGQPAKLTLRLFN